MQLPEASGAQTVLGVTSSADPELAFGEAKRICQENDLGYRTSTKVPSTCTFCLWVLIGAMGQWSVALAISANAFSQVFVGLYAVSAYRCAWQKELRHII